MIRWRREGAPPLILGHRGASAHEVENTIEAFARAVADGADGFELDVRLCATGEVVVFHDEDLRRLAGLPVNVGAMPLAALRRVTLERERRISTLDEVLDAFPEVLINVELKARAGRGAAVADAAIASIARHAATDRVLVSSFEPVALARVRLRSSGLATGYLFHRNQGLALRRGWPAFGLRTTAVHPDHALVTRQTVSVWRRAGFSINTWTVDDPADVRRVTDLGVDAIITNDPARTRSSTLARS
jgi:glycerophosphoryl diester phosphodiesterase